MKAVEKNNDEGTRAMEDQERFNAICKPRLERIEDSLMRIETRIVGNGKPGLMVQVAEHGKVIAGLIAMDVVILGGLIGIWLKG